MALHIGGHLPVCQYNMLQCNILIHVLALGNACVLSNICFTVVFCGHCCGKCALRSVWRCEDFLWTLCRPATGVQEIPALHPAPLHSHCTPIAALEAEMLEVGLLWVHASLKAPFFVE